MIHFSLRSVRRICSQKCCVYGFRRSLFGGSSPPPSPLRGGGLPSHIRQMVRPPGPTDWNPRRDHRLAVASCFASDAVPDVPRGGRTRQTSRIDQTFAQVVRLGFRLRISSQPFRRKLPASVTHPGGGTAETTRSLAMHTSRGGWGQLPAFHRTSGRWHAPVPGEMLGGVVPPVWWCFSAVSRCWLPAAVVLRRRGGHQDAVWWTAPHERESEGEREREREKCWGPGRPSAGPLAYQAQV